MQKKTHLAFGLFLFSILFTLGLPFHYSLLVGFAAFLPDIDWLMDKIWFKEDSIFKKLWRKVFKSRSIHRTFLHNIWSLLFFISLFGYFSNWDLLVILAVSLGYLSHLLMDSLTVSGVYWLWPYGDERIWNMRKFYKNGKFSTGGPKEKVLFILFVAIGGVFLGYGLYRNYSFRTGSVYQSILTIGIFLLIGIGLMQRLVKEISRVTSRMFRK